VIEEAKLVMSADIELDKADDIHEVWRETLGDLFQYMGKRIKESGFRFAGTVPAVRLSYEQQRWDAMLTLELEQLCE
jgi:hypothetical protein